MWTRLNIIYLYVSDSVLEHFLNISSLFCPQSEYRFAGGGYPRASSGGGRSGGFCSAALVGGALLAAFAVLAVAALAFYMGALRPDNGERE